MTIPKEFQELPIGAWFKIIKFSPTIFMRIQECTHNGKKVNILCIKSDVSQHIGVLSHMQDPQYLVFSLGEKDEK
jgi:hypothetical protein